MINDLKLNDFSDLLHKLYNGPTEDDPFSSFLESVRDILDLNFSSITLRQPEGDNGGLLFISSEFLAKTFVDAHDNVYTDRYYAIDPLSDLNYGDVVSLDEVCSEQQLISSDFYKLCMEPLELHYMMGIDLKNYNGKRFTVRFCRPNTSTAFTQDEKDFLTLLAPHLQRAVVMGSQLSQIDSERQLFAAAMSGYSIGTISLSETGKVIKVNQVAKSIIDLKDGINVLHDQIWLNNHGINKTLREFIEEALELQRNKKINTARALSIPRRSGKPDFEIIIKALPVDHHIEAKNSPHLMVFLSSPERKFTISVKALMSLYDLTISEATLTALLAEGKDLDQIAEELQIARNTARAHLRSIFAKTGVTRQPMLVSMVLKSLAALPIYNHHRPPDSLS